MPCDTLARTEAERKAQADAVKELELDIATGKRTIVRQLDGSLTILNWGNSTAAKLGMCDGCVLERVANGNNWVAKSKLAAVGITKNKQFVAGGHAHGKGHNH